LLQSSGGIRVGWITREARLHMANRDGGDEWNPLGFMWHDLNCSNSIQNAADMHGDVVGALIDVSTRRFVFYKNGKEIERPEPEMDPLRMGRFSSQPYFAAVLFDSMHQQCFFNFGQAPFKHPPSDVEFQTF